MLVSGFVSRLVLSGLQLDVRLPNAVFAQQSFHLSVTLRNLKRRFPSYSIWIAATADSRRRRRGRARRKDDRAAGAMPGPRLDLQSIYCPLIGGGGKATVSTPAVFPRRGCFENQVFWLRDQVPVQFRRAPGSAHAYEKNHRLPVGRILTDGRQDTRGLGGPAARPYPRGEPRPLSNPSRSIRRRRPIRRLEGYRARRGSDGQRVHPRRPTTGGSRLRPHIAHGETSTAGSRCRVI